MGNSSYDMMQRMGLISEDSINAKKRNVKRIENFFRKGNNNVIKCFAVFTAENPDSQPTDRKTNKNLNKELFDTLRVQYTIVPTQGKFGNVENSFIVFNITRENAMYYCGKYQQTSFVYSSIDEDGQLLSEYWEKQDAGKPYDKKTNPYVEKDRSAEWVDMSGADDFYTIVGKKFKYSIPFSIFESYSNGLKSMLESATENEDAIMNIIVEGVGYGAFYMRSKFRVESLMND